jgi:hypothetical protein
MLILRMPDIITKDYRGIHCGVVIDILDRQLTPYPLRRTALVVYNPWTSTTSAFHHDLKYFKIRYVRRVPPLCSLNKCSVLIVQFCLETPILRCPHRILEVQRKNGTLTTSFTGHHVQTETTDHLTVSLYAYNVKSARNYMYGKSERTRGLHPKNYRTTLGGVIACVIFVLI